MNSSSRPLWQHARPACGRRPSHKMKIRKVTIGVTLLMHDSDEDRLSTMSLARIGEEMDFGDMVGAIAITTATDVPPHSLQAEITATGTAGTSFDARKENAVTCRSVQHERIQRSSRVGRRAREQHAGMPSGRA